MGESHISQDPTLVPTLRNKNPYRTIEKGALLPAPSNLGAICFPVIKILLACCLCVHGVHSSIATSKNPDSGTIFSASLSSKDAISPSSAPADTPAPRSCSLLLHPLPHGQVCATLPPTIEKCHLNMLARSPGPARRHPSAGRG